MPKLFSKRSKKVQIKEGLLGLDYCQRLGSYCEEAQLEGGDFQEQIVDKINDRLAQQIQEKKEEIAKEDITVDGCFCKQCTKKRLMTAKIINVDKEELGKSLIVDEDQEDEEDELDQDTKYLD